MFEFAIDAKGRRIQYARLRGATDAALETYLFGQVLSFALVERGFEPLHATALELDGRAFCFLAAPGTGKSTLAAACLVNGARLLTDDIMLVDAHNEVFDTLPGLPRLKIDPGVASAILGDFASTGEVNPFTTKLVVALPPERFRAERLR